MQVLEARNVNHALALGIDLINREGVKVDSRNGDTLEIINPVATVYRRPWERVLISSLRDANPFFHLMESMWILAGREDVKFLNEFNKRMVDYSDDGEIFNAPYGYRLRKTLDGEYFLDQLEEIIDILNNDPNSRQAVAQIWDYSDLIHSTKDKACNMSIVFRVRLGKLCMTVYNRSNDMIWGAYGANVVQFSMIQEYVAAKLGLRMGTYTQITNSYHVYTTGPGGKVWNRLNDKYNYCPSDYYDTDITNIVKMCTTDMINFEQDLKLFFKVYDEFGLKELGEMVCWQSKYFQELIMPVLCVYLTHKDKGPEEAIKYTKSIKGDDWRMACEDWLLNRIINK